MVQKIYNFTGTINKKLIYYAKQIISTVKLNERSILAIHKIILWVGMIF